MITKNYTADRTETPGDATSTIPAAMANYWINGVNSLISDLTPLKDAGGFYAPVDFNFFRCTSVSDASNPSIRATVPLTKVIGNLVLSSNIITLQKGFLYEATLDFAYHYTGPSGINYFDLVDSSTLASKLQTINEKISAGMVTTESGCVGKGIIDLTSASSDLSVKVHIPVTSGAGYIADTIGGLFIKKMKLIPFTATT